MPASVPTVKLSNGKQMPILGVGTLGWGQDPADIAKAVEVAIDIGYRHIDTAYAYQNEKVVGEAIRKKISEGKVKREDIFLTTKLHGQFHRRADVTKCLKKSLADLGFDYVDLYLVHGPMGIKHVEGNLFPSENGVLQVEDPPIDHLETWKGMEDVYNAGLAKAIGLSNHNSKQIQRIYDNATVKPMALQVECNAYFKQHELHEFCKKLNIVFTAWSPLGAPWRAAGTGTPFDDKNSPNLLQDPDVIATAQKYKKQPAQIVLRYLTQRGIVAIPKSSNPDRLRQNFEIFDITIAPEDMKIIDNLKVNQRAASGGLGFSDKHPQYPFNEPF